MTFHGRNLIRAEVSVKLRFFRGIAQTIVLRPSHPKFGSKELGIIGFKVYVCYITCPINGEFWRVNRDSRPIRFRRRFALCTALFHADQTVRSQLLLWFIWLFYALEIVHHYLTLRSTEHWWSTIRYSSFHTKLNPRFRTPIIFNWNSVNNGWHARNLNWSWTESRRLFRPCSRARWYHMSMIGDWIFHGFTQNSTLGWSI
jgi:hypothetical protein